MEGSPSFACFCWKQTISPVPVIFPNLWLIEVHQDLRQQFKVQLIEQCSRLMRVYCRKPLFWFVSGQKLREFRMMPGLQYQEQPGRTGCSCFCPKWECIKTIVFVGNDNCVFEEVGGNEENIWKLFYQFYHGFAVNILYLPRLSSWSWLLWGQTSYRDLVWW